MLDSIKIISNYASVNNFQSVSTLRIMNGVEPFVVTIQLWQTDLKMRYVPEAGSTAQIEFLRHDSIAITPVTQTIKKPLQQASGQDTSIWKVSLTAAETAKIVSGGFRVTLKEPTGGTKIVESTMSVRKEDSASSPF